MNYKKLAKLLFLLRDKPEFLAALIKIYGSGDQDVIDATDSLIMSCAKEIESRKEGSNA
jgi:hypothetical protein